MTLCEVHNRKYMSNACSLVNIGRHPWGLDCPPIKCIYVHFENLVGGMGDDCGFLHRHSCPNSYFHWLVCFFIVTTQVVVS